MTVARAAVRRAPALPRSRGRWSRRARDRSRCAGRSMSRGSVAPRSRRAGSPHAPPRARRRRRGRGGGAWTCSLHEPGLSPPAILVAGRRASARARCAAAPRRRGCELPGPRGGCLDPGAAAGGSWRAMPGADLVEELLARPDDLELRLVLADRLQDAGDPRGELMAVQCALAAARDAGARAELRARELALARSVRPELDPAVVDLEWRLGFLAAATVLERAGEVVPALLAHPAARLIQELAVAVEPEALAA